MPKFPKQILVTWEEQSNDDPFLITHEDIESIDNPETKVAVYQLVHVGQVKIDRTFIHDTKKRPANGRRKKAKKQ